MNIRALKQCNLINDTETAYPKRRITGYLEVSGYKYSNRFIIRCIRILDSKPECEIYSNLGKRVIMVPSYDIYLSRYDSFLTIAFERVNNPGVYKFEIDTDMFMGYGFRKLSSIIPTMY